MLAPLLVAAVVTSAAQGEDGPVVVDDPATVVDSDVAAVDAATAVVDGAANVVDGAASVVDSAATVVDSAATVVDGPANVVEDAAGPAAAAAAEPEAQTKTGPEPGFSFSGIPAVNYIADNGLGLGVIVAGYYNDGVTLPYRAAVTLQLFVTTNLVQDHNLVVDVLKVADQPLRLTGRVGFIGSLTQNYCGVGGNLSCDPAVAEDAADERGLSGDDKDAFVRHYYQRRFINPYGLLNARYALVEKSATAPRVEVTAGYRGFYFVPGNPFADDDQDGAPDLTPYDGSLYQADFPDGEPGFSSVLNVGMMMDSRDNEPAPTEGWWSEISVRAATPFWLSTWTYAGANLTLRGYKYLPVHPWLEKRLVLANRLTFDGVVGDIPIQELARLGGSQDVYAFGGADMGRGIRVQRYLGKGKVLNQTELRYRFAEVELFEQQFAFTVAGFVDAAIVADELIAPKNVGTSAGGGGAFRIAWNENFVIRADLGVSPIEDWAPQLYITINQPF